MESRSVLARWNDLVGTKLFISEKLMQETFFSLPENSRTVLDFEHSAAFCKFDQGDLRIHLLVPKTQDYEKIIPKLDDFKKSNALQKIIFGGGDKHIFPGIPLEPQLDRLSKHFEPSGPVVMDYEGQLNVLIEKAALVVGEGELKAATEPSLQKDLRTFVQSNFAGRWAREISDDFSRNFSEHYFAYTVNREIVGYVRLYGWRKDYWAPGVYFRGPAVGGGGLGPIGVSQKFRGKGFGAQIQKLSWNVLKEKKCSTVRIDWTTETTFYEQRGLQLVQSYQPAFRN
jgi:hypothetical protein